MSSSKRKPGSRAGHSQLRSKVMLLPMPQKDADEMGLQSRLAFEAVLHGKASRRDVLGVVQATLLTGFITEAGHGLLELGFIRQVEDEVLSILHSGEKDATWEFSEALLTSLRQIINEHDRQLRETRLGIVIAAVQKLDRRIASSSSKLSAA